MREGGKERGVKTILFLVTASHSAENYPANDPERMPEVIGGAKTSACCLGDRRIDPFHGHCRTSPYLVPFGRDRYPRCIASPCGCHSLPTELYGNPGGADARCNEVSKGDVGTAKMTECIETAREHYAAPRV